MSAEEFTAFLRRAWVCARAILGRWRDPLRVHGLAPHGGAACRRARPSTRELKNLCVWTKTNAGQGSFYRSQHELVFVFKHGTAPHVNTFELGQHGRNRTNVWPYAGVNSFRAGRLDELKLHPTVKPVALVADAMRDCSRRGDIVLDAFAGSGTTIVAAEQIGRRAYCLELDPAYADVSIRRWQAYTKRDAILEGTGETFEELSALRSSERGRRGVQARPATAGKAPPIAPATESARSGTSRPGAADEAATAQDRKRRSRSGDYEVGYGSPPSHTSSSRAKAAIRTAARKAHAVSLPRPTRCSGARSRSSSAGRRKSVPADESILHRFREVALKGDVKAARSCWPARAIPLVAARDDAGARSSAHRRIEIIEESWPDRGRDPHRRKADRPKRGRVRIG